MNGLDAFLHVHAVLKTSGSQGKLQIDVMQMNLGKGSFSFERPQIRKSCAWRAGAPGPPAVRWLDCFAALLRAPGPQGGIRAATSLQKEGTPFERFSRAGGQALAAGEDPSDASWPTVNSGAADNHGAGAD